MTAGLMSAPVGVSCGLFCAVMSVLATCIACSFGISGGIGDLQLVAIGNVEQLPVAAVGHDPHDGAVGGPVVHTAGELEAAVPPELDDVADLDIVPVF